MPDALDSLAAAFRLVSVSRQYPNRNSEFVRVYVEVEAPAAECKT